MKEHLALLAASVAIIHPEIYEIGWEVLVWLSKWAAIQEDLDLKDVLPLWLSVYNVVSVMANKQLCFTPILTEGPSGLIFSSQSATILN